MRFSLAMTSIPLRALYVFALLALVQCDCEPDGPEPEAAEELVEGERVAVPNAAVIPAEEVPWENVDFPAPAGALGLDLSPSTNGLVATWVEPELHRVRLSRFDGEWSEPVTIVENEALVANWADFPRSAEGGDGALYVNAMFQAGSAAHAYEVRLFRSTDAIHFAPLGLLHRDGTETEHGFVSMAATNDGVQVYWLDGRGNVDDGFTAVYSAAAHGDGDGDGARVDSARLVDPQVCDCCQTDAAMSAGAPMVVYRDRTDGEIRDISAARGVPGSEGAVHISSVHDDAWEMRGCPVNGPAIATDEAETAVAWFSGAEGGAVYVAFGDGDGEGEGAGFGPRFVVDGLQPPGRVDVSLVPDGAAVSWLARRGVTDGAAVDGVDGEVRVRFVSDEGVLASATLVGETGTGSAAGFPVMERYGPHLYVGYRGADAQLRIRRLSVDALPRGPATAPVDAAPPVEVGATLGGGAQLQGSDGEQISLAGMAAEASAERPLVVAFFARWCQPCREELAALERLRAAHPNWNVVAVSIDEGSGERAERVARSWGFQGVVLRDAGAAAALRVPPLPGAFAWSGSGLAFVSVGELFDPASLEAALAE